jgi:formate C-acetyltransferase
MLEPYLAADLAAGRIGLEEAREILAHMWINGCQWVGAASRYIPGAGDGHYFQNVILGGTGADGEEIANEVTCLVLDVVEELAIGDWPVTVRLSRRTPERLLRRVAEVQRAGGGAVSVYNEEVAIAGLCRFGYPLAEARSFTNDGCWEALIPGKTNFGYWQFDTLTLLHDMLGARDPWLPVPSYGSFEDLYRAWRARLGRVVEEGHRLAGRAGKNGRPAVLASLLTEDCIERAKDYHDGGARYTVRGIHADGVAWTPRCGGFSVEGGHAMKGGEGRTDPRDSWRRREFLQRKTDSGWKVLS